MILRKSKFAKTDISGKELPGAKLTILDQEGNEVERWTSGEKAHYIEMLPIGKYTLHEVSAPDGYLVAEDIIFEVKDTGEIQKVVMKDERKPSENVEQPQESKPTGNAPQNRRYQPCRIVGAVICNGSVTGRFFLLLD